MGGLAFTGMLSRTAGLSSSFDAVEDLVNCRERRMEAIFSLRRGAFLGIAFW